MVPSVAWGGLVSYCVFYHADGKVGRWWRGSHLDDHKASTAGVGSCEVDIGLVARDVESLNGSALLNLGSGSGRGGGKAEDGSDGDGRELHVCDLLRIVDTTEKG